VSEQVPTVFNLSIKFDTEGNVVGAGGFFIQKMPDATEEMTKEIETIFLKLDSPGLLISEGKSSEDIIMESFADYGPKILGEHRVEFFCRCTDDLMENYLSMLPEKELKDIVENGPFPLELTCHNCNTNYCFEKQQLEAIYQSRQKQKK
jgi:molecular chaperone Hsp33